MSYAGFRGPTRFVVSNLHLLFITERHADTYLCVHGREPALFEVALPEQFYPDKLFDHSPPRFDYAVALTRSEILRYAFQEKLIPEEKHPEHLYPGLCNMICDHLSNKFDLVRAQKIDWGVPSIDEDLISFNLFSNFESYIPMKKLAKSIAEMKQAFQKIPQWYLSHHNKFRPRYTISKEKFLSVKVPASDSDSASG
ncbi:hypothetical protein PM082_021124 [Marasmius tenuissimus]|nr:hypothetical protein PM082_021124 [Marasmius tenuissimus]